MVPWNVPFKHLFSRLLLTLVWGLPFKKLSLNLWLRQVKGPLPVPHLPPPILPRDTALTMLCFVFKLPIADIPSDTSEHFRVPSPLSRR